MGLGGEASHLRHEVQRNQQDPDNGKVTLIALLIIAVLSLVCIVGCISKDAEKQEAINAVEQTEQSEQGEATEQVEQTEDIYGHPSQEEWEEEYLDDAIKAYGEQMEYDDYYDGAPY